MWVLNGRINPDPREAREAKGLTQAALAGKAGVSQQAISALENGGNVTLGILTLVGDALGVEFHLKASKKGAAS